MPTEVIRTIQELRGRSLREFGKREEPRDFLLCRPDFFDVVDVKNPHMEGQLGKVNRSKASLQWNALKQTIEASGRTAYVLEPTKGLEDMVFTANPALPGLGPEGEKICLLSNMTHPSRQKEVAAHRKWFEKHGYKIVTLSNSQWRFEGQGDALWHPERRMLWGGYGFRTVPDVYQEISKLFDVPVIVLELKKEHFYHLDTCLSPLSETEALYYPPAFTRGGRDLIQALFKDAIEIDEMEAVKGFACNGLPLGKKVLLQKGNRTTSAALTKKGYEPIELDTSEYLKSGGSVFCMKLEVYP